MTGKRQRLIVKIIIAFAGLFFNLSLPTLINPLFYPLVFPGFSGIIACDLRGEFI